MKRIFNARDYVAGLDVQGMETGELLKAIKLLANDRLDKAHFSYYVDRLDAISILIDRAIEEHTAEKAD